MSTVINTACTDRQQIARAIASIDPADWELLGRVAPLLKSRDYGLYKLWELPQIAPAD